MESTVIDSWLKVQQTMLPAELTLCQFLHLPEMGIYHYSHGIRLMLTHMMKALTKQAEMLSAFLAFDTCFCR